MSSDGSKLLRKQIGDSMELNDPEMVKDAVLIYLSRSEKMSNDTGIYGIISNAISTSFYFRDNPTEMEKIYKILEFLLEKFTDVNKLNEFSPINSICATLGLCSRDKKYIESGNIVLKILELLLNYGASCKTIDKWHNTPLHNLLYYGYCTLSIKAIKILIRGGIDVNKKNLSGMLALEIVINSSRYDNANHYNNTYTLSKIIDLIMNNGFNIFNLDLPKKDFIATYSIWGYVFTRSLNKEIAKKDEEIMRLKKKIEELKYKPGNPGYWEAMKDFEVFKGKMNKKK